MGTFDTKSLLDTLSVPLGDLISSVGRGVADAQRELDAGSMNALREIYTSNEGLFADLQRIGYRPTWYHIPEVESELQVALTISGSESQTGGSAPSSKVKLYATPVDAGYASRFNFNLQASSKVKFKIVPVPPSTMAEGLQVVPSLLGLSLAQARERLAVLDVNAQLPEQTDSTVVRWQEPEPGTMVQSGALVTLGSAETVPSLVGSTLGQARARLSAIGMAATLPNQSDTTIVTGQEPAPLALLASGGKVTVKTGG